MLLKELHFSLPILDIPEIYEQPLLAKSPLIAYLSMHQLILALLDQ